MMDHAAAVAEQVLIGGLLQAPTEFARVGWLTSTAFNYPEHEALFDTMRQLIPSTSAVTMEPAEWRDAVYERARAADGARGLTRADLDRLANCCPDPRHAHAYARIVAEHAERREIGLLAERVARALDRSAGDQIVAHAVEQLVAARPDDDRADLAAGARAEFSPIHEAWRAAARTPGQLMVRVRAEDPLLAALIREGLTGHSEDCGLAVEHFLAPGRAEIYAAMLELHHRDEPVDAVTVAATAEAFNGLARPAAGEPPHDGRLTARQLLVRTGEPSPPHGRYLLARFLAAPNPARTVAAEAAGLARIAADPSVPVAQLRARLAAAVTPLAPPRPMPPAAAVGARSPTGLTR
jgi:replicative DNA helicase